MGDLITGKLGYVFLVSILDAAVLSWVALWWYGRSLSRLMLGRGNSAEPAAVVAEAPGFRLPDTGDATTAQGGFAFRMIEPEKGPPAKPSKSANPVARRRVVLAYCVGAALYSAVITALTLASDASSTRLVVWFSMWWINAWPIVPTLIALLVLDRRGSLRLVGTYIGAGAIALSLLTLAGQVARGSFNTAPLTNMYGLAMALALTAYAPLALILITGWRPIRAVTPLALASTLVFGFSLMAFREGINEAFNVAAVRTAILALAQRSSTSAAYYGPFMLLSLPVGWVAWRVLQSLAAGFEHKRFSDVQLVIDCWWLVATAEAIATGLSPIYGFGSVAGGAVAFLAYRAGVAAVLRGRPGGQELSGRRLLLLRVFGYRSRTESLFDRVAQSWRFHGPVLLIAGADLARRTVDPADMLAFIRGRLADQYVATRDEVPERLNRLDLAPDPDGRFRVSELYCRRDTWQPTLQALLDASDAVMMDLRSFSERNAGCIFELEQLIMRVPVDKVVLIADQTTDLRLLNSVLGEAWDKAAREGRVRGDARMALVVLKRQSWRTVNTLMEQLLATTADPFSQPAHS
jgi:hypothetical protein